MPAREVDDPQLTRGVPGVVSRSLTATAMWTGAAAALLGATVGMAIALLCWLPDAGVSGHPLSAMRAGLLGFVAVQHGGIAVNGTPVGFVPLAGTIVVALIAWRAGAVLGDVAERHAETRGRVLSAALAAQAVSYALSCAFVAAVATLGTSSASSIRTAVAGFLLFGTVAAVSLCRSPVLVRWWRARLADCVVDGVRAAAAAVAVVIGSGALLVAGSLLVHADRVMRLSGLVGGGLSGIALLVVGVLSAPNAALAAAAYVTGPGFAVGSGTVVSPFATTRGTLPAVPILGAVPDGHGARPLVVGWLVLTLVVAGSAAARLLRRRTIAEAVRGLTVAAGGAGLGLAVLVWFAGGSLGADRLQAVGASPWRVGLAATAEVATVGIVLLSLSWLWRWLTVLAQRDDDEQPDEPALVQVGDR